MSEPTTAAGRRLSLRRAQQHGVDLTDAAAMAVVDADVLAIEAEARRAALDEAIAAVDAVIFDLPIGNNVDYSRGYSAAVAVDRELLRDALTTLRDGV